MSGVGDPPIGHVFREYAVALMAAAMAWLAGMIAVRCEAAGPVILLLQNVRPEYICRG